MTLRHRYTPEDYVGMSLIVGNRLGEDDVEIELEEHPSELGDFFRARPGEPAIETAPIAYVREGAVFIRPNDVPLRGGTPVEGEEGTFTIPPSGTARLGVLSLRAVGRIRATLEVRNVLGNRARKTLDVTLGQATEAHAALGEVR
jgi:hypothetical protein